MTLRDYRVLQLFHSVVIQLFRDLNKLSGFEVSRLRRIYKKVY